MVANVAAHLLGHWGVGRDTSLLVVVLHEKRGYFVLTVAENAWSAETYSLILSENSDLLAISIKFESASLQVLLRLVARSIVY